MSTTVTYKGSTLTTVDNQTRKLLTAGKYCEDDFTLTDVTQGGTVNLVPYGIRPDAEIIKTYTFDQMLVEDLEVAIPAYSTTAKTLVASENLSPTITVALADYDYRVIVRMLAYPTYKEGTAIATGRLDYWEGTLMYDLVSVPANTFESFAGKKYATRSSSVYQSGAYYRELYYSSASAVTVYATAAYGIYMVSTAPAISSSTFTIKSPTLNIRGHATYLRSAVWSTLEDIRYQYVIDVLRAPKGNLNIDGWGSFQSTLHIVDCALNNQGKLT